MSNVLLNGGIIGANRTFSDQPTFAPLTYVGGRTQTTVGTTGNISVALTGLTGGVATQPAAGDTVIIVFAAGTTGTLTYRITGYTQIASLYSNASTYDGVLQVGYKVMGATPDTTATITGGTGSTSFGGSIAVYVWRNVDQTTPIDCAPATLLQTTTAVPNPPAYLPFTSGAQIIVAAGSGNSGNGATYTASYLSSFLTATGNGTYDGTVGVGYVGWTSGLYDPAAWTFGTTDSTTYGCASVVFALRPATVQYTYPGIWPLESFYENPYRIWATPANYFKLVGNPIDIFGWGGTAGVNSCTVTRDTTVTDSPYGGIPLKMAITGNDPYLSTYNAAQWNISPAASGQTWQVSAIAKASTVTDGQLFVFGADSTSAIIDFNAGSFTINTTWTEVSYTFTFTNAAVAFIQTRVDGTGTGGAGINIWWDGLQVYRIA